MTGVRSWVNRADSIVLFRLIRTLTANVWQVDGGWQLNGAKRWIGNATFADYTVIWARSSESNQVNAFVVKKGTKGFETSKIEGKIALRCVQNADITLTNCFVPDSARLPGVNSFQVSFQSQSQHFVRMRMYRVLIVQSPGA